MGNGFFIWEIVSKNETVRYCGCDFSQTMVEEALLFNEEYVNNGQVCFVKANATRLPFRNETFDKLFTVNTIYFWKDIEIFISEIKRALTKNGLFVLSLRPRSVMGKLPIIQYGFQTFSKADCIRILRNNGFKIISSNEYEDDDLELGGTKYKNAFMIIKATKN
jgi:ubiquinone/menaquinone biosynthesis C-methylase UbiE